MITKAQRQYLKGLANNVKPLVKVGKMGLTENIIKSIEEVLTAHEIVKIDVDRFGHIAKEYKVLSIPALKIFSNGEVIKEKTGLMSRDEIKKFIEE